MRPRVMRGVVGAAVGGGVGGWYAALTGQYLYAGLGAALGALVGSLVEMASRRRGGSSAQPLPIESPFFRVIGVLALVLAVAGLVGFLRTGRWVGVLGAILFALGAVYCFRRAKT
jgi:hypothetical protein